MVPLQRSCLRWLFAALALLAPLQAQADEPASTAIPAHLDLENALRIFRERGLDLIIAVRWIRTATIKNNGKFLAAIGWPLALALVVFAGCGGDRAVDEPSDAAAVDAAARDAAALDAAGSDDGGAPLIACQWSGAPGTCITTSACAAIVDHTSEPGSCPGPTTIECCIDTPSVADNPPVPAGWQLMAQSQVTPAMTDWAVMILHDPVG